jgi:hypothetical protein
VTTLDPVPEITKITVVVENANGDRAVLRATNERPLTTLRMQRKDAGVLGEEDFRLDSLSALRPIDSTVGVSFTTTGEFTLQHIDDHDTLIDPEAGDAAESAVRSWECYANATDPMSQAHHLINLADHMGDLASWVPPEEYED